MDFFHLPGDLRTDGRSPHETFDERTAWKFYRLVISTPQAYGSWTPRLHHRPMSSFQSVVIGAEIVSLSISGHAARVSVCSRRLYVDFKRCYGSESLRHLSSTLTEQTIPKVVPSVYRSFMPEGQRCRFRLKASIQGLDHNIRRYRNSLAMHLDVFLARCQLMLFHVAPQKKCIRFPTLRGFILSHSKRRCQGQEQNAV